MPAVFLIKFFDEVRLVSAVTFSRLRDGLCFVYSSWRVFGRCVNRIQLKRSSAVIDKVMPFAGRNEYRIIIKNLFLKNQAGLSVAHLYHSLAFLDANKLIVIDDDLAYVFRYSGSSM